MCVYSCTGHGHKQLLLEWQSMCFSYIQKYWTIPVHDLKVLLIGLSMFFDKKYIAEK